MKLTSTAVAAGALLALGTTSALGIEHQFSGRFTALYDVSNFNGSRTGQSYYNPVSYNDGTRVTTFEKNAPTANFVESRARIGYTAKASNSVKLVSIFELDYSYWGNSSYSVGRNQGSALGADTVNIETKHLYLDADICRDTNLKLGMQGFDDAFKGVFVSSDMAGVSVTHRYTNASTSLGAFRWDDKSDSTNKSLGRQTRDFIVLDGKYNLNKETKVGGAYYFMKDNTGSLDDNIHMIGVNAETVAGSLAINGFVVGQYGEVDAEHKDLSAYAASLGASMQLGKGTLRGDILYATGDKGTSSSKSHAFQSTAYEGGYYANEMVILGRDKNAFTNDNAIVYDANNRDQGVYFGSIGYDMPLSDKLSASCNLGFASIAQENESKPRNIMTGKTNSSNYLGTEVNAEAGYKVSDNMSFSARAGYVFLGDYYKNISANGTPDNPYDLKLIAKFSF